MLDRNEKVTRKQSYRAVIWIRIWGSLLENPPDSRSA
jgi:hypothetical protein